MEEIKSVVENGDICAGPASPRSEFRQRSARSDPTRQRSAEAAECIGTDGDLSTSSLHKFWHRAGWLVLLLMCQSTSSVILEHFEALIRSHPVVIYFLTMLVGAGGNAGSQSTVLVVRQLAIAAARGERQNGERWTEIQRILGTEASVGARLAVVLFAASFVRCIVFQVRGVECLAICLSMLAIVFTSTLLGAALPLVLNRFGFDPAHAGAAIQVMMDISGVTITCIISCAVLGVHIDSAMPVPTAVHATSGSRLPGIQHEGVYKLNSFGSFEVPEGI
mmetsp:Transcript_84112/g.132810  ORF Transcript_84112/g.132810 Transcript_84112/m.132810 type:complete len:278 (+) Transcript_84112:66-899(+)